MNEDKNNKQDDSTEPVSEPLTNSCAKCDNNPCTCSEENDGSTQKETQPNKKSADEEKPPRTKPPKISWI